MTDAVRAAAETLWRQDPGLAGRFHPDHPDDLQVLCHDGEPRRTQRPPELCWVTVTGCEPGPARRVLAASGRDTAYRTALAARPWGPLDVVYVGQLLNRPTHLTSVDAGDILRFVLAPGLDHGLLVTPAYLAERPAWGIAPCDRCGFFEGLDPPTVLGRTRFPDAPADAVLAAFSAFCPLCGGTQMFETHAEGEAVARMADPPPSPRRPWWRFWG